MNNYLLKCLISSIIFASSICCFCYPTVRVEKPQEVHFVSTHSCFKKSNKYILFKEKDNLYFGYSNNFARACFSIPFCRQLSILYIDDSNGNALLTLDNSLYAIVHTSRKPVLAKIGSSLEIPRDKVLESAHIYKVEGNNRARKYYLTYKTRDSQGTLRTSSENFLIHENDLITKTYKTSIIVDYQRNSY